MNILNWPWTKVRAPRPYSTPQVKARLVLEVLEDRLAPSANPMHQMTHRQWAKQEYSVNDVIVANQVQASVSQSVGTNVTGGFGADINLPQVDAAYPNLNGAGYAVAIIDTGIDYNNSNLGGGWGNRVIAGWDFVNNDANPMDDNGHGTHVAGIIGSSDATYGGVAPNVNFIALKVLDANGSGSFGNVELALQWVVSHQAQYNIVAINMSLGAGNYTVNPYTFLDDEFTSLKNQGVFIALAAGNSYSSQQGLAFPAIDPLGVAVGAVYSGNFGAEYWGSGAIDYTTGQDRIASFSQRGTALDIFAPGAMITSTYLNNTFQTMAGTSMATPVIAGSAVLLHEALDKAGQHAKANQDYILSLMQSTGKTIIDGDDENDNVVNTGLSFKRIDLFAALGSITTTGNVAPVLSPINNLTMKAGGTATVALSATDANGDPITYTAQVVGSTGTSSGSSQAYQLDQQLGLTQPASDYFFNSWGQNEKWLLGTGDLWYCLMANGDLRQWAGSMTATLQPSALIASLGVSYYNDPSLLWNAQAPGSTPNVTLTITGNQLSINAPAGYIGTFSVLVTASDGSLSSAQTFTVTTVANRAPVLRTIANASVRPGTAVVINLSATDADNDPITYSAKIVGGSSSGVSLSMNGNRLTVRATSTAPLGVVQIQVSASDGTDIVSQVFSVTKRRFA